MVHGVVGWFFSVSPIRWTTRRAEEAIGASLNKFVAVTFMLSSERSEMQFFPASRGGEGEAGARCRAPV